MLIVGVIVSVNFNEIFEFKEQQIRTVRAFMRRRDVVYFVWLGFLVVVFFTPMEP